MARKVHKGPTAKARKAYGELIVKAYQRLEKVVAKHHPKKLIKR